MPQSLLLWGMVLKEIDYLLDIEREGLLRQQTRYIEFPKNGSTRVDAYALVWGWYDRLINHKHGPCEDRFKATWLACMDEEQITVSDALVRLVHYYVAGAERLGLDYTQDRVALNVAQRQMAKWRDRKAQR